MIQNVLRTVLLFVLITAGLVPRTASAQEFDCTVEVDYSQLSGSEYTFLSNLDEQVENYINNRSWTEDRFLKHERIDCQMQIILEEATSLTDFQARLILSMRRPIYNTTQYSTVVQINDSPWQFSYTQGSSLTYSPERYDPLTSVIDFYAYIMLGYDYDTFSELGGSPYFAQAQRIAQMARTAQAPGWSQVGQEQGRWSLISQLTDAQYRPLRRAYYSYHFGGLDHFVEDTEAARATILEVLRNLRSFSENVSRQYLMDLFFSAKATELAAIFEGSDMRSEAYALLTTLDSSSEYERLINQ